MSVELTAWQREIADAMKKLITPSPRRYGKTFAMMIGVLELAYAKPRIAIQFFDHIQFDNSNARMRQYAADQLADVALNHFPALSGTLTIYINGHCVWWAGQDGKFRVEVTR